MPWLVGFLDEETKAALDALPVDFRASYQRIVELIQAHGLERVREPDLKHLRGPLWEMQDWHCVSHLRYGNRHEDCRSPCLRRENAQGSTQRNRLGHEEG